MRIHIFLPAIAALLAACQPSSIKPFPQDGTELWLAAGRPVSEIQASVESRIDPSLPAEGFHIHDSCGVRHIAAGSDAGLMYGVYALQRAEVLGKAGPGMDLEDKPLYDLRILNHWDNLDDTVERGYAGLSMWEWTSDAIPEERIRKYGELCASVGINGSVLNNVNSNPLILDTEHIARVASIADILREYGVKVYLSVKWTSPIALNGLGSGDPLDPAVRKWWKAKAAEIYAAIPDFGGFLVKANSEGQAGPQDYGRTHADGANMLAEALEPFGGIVMWRAFVYNPESPDRANQAVEEFLPLDGKFAPNVIVQIKNGPIDFQPREPFSPLFGKLRDTRMMVEFQITQEYLGFSNHLAYLGTAWEECLKADTFRDGEGSTVARMVTAVAGVANTGRDPNFCGYVFAPANWYAFGRLAWNPYLGAEDIADEWIRQTFLRPEGMSGRAFDNKVVKPLTAMLMASREAVVNYEMPLGLHHLFGGTHYGPMPWERLSRPDWTPSYYHKADSTGIGFDRTDSGSGNVRQYNEPLASTYNNLETCPENLLLWFHHLPWDYRMKSGKTLWDEICLHYDAGIRTVDGFRKTWKAMKPYVATALWKEADAKLAVQANDARWWRDACVGYFQLSSGRPVPSEVEPLSRDGGWVTTWATALQVAEPHNLPPDPGLAGNSFRQIVHVSLGGEELRLHLSNQFNETPTEILGVEIAVAETMGESPAVVEATAIPLSFGGYPGATMAPGGMAVSDAVKFHLEDRMNLAVTIHYGQVSDQPLTSHPGSRTTSYIANGYTSDFSAPAAETNHWYTISSIDVKRNGAAIAVLGDSITDGRGSTTNGQDRWPDVLSRSLLSDPATSNLAVLNFGLGGNCVLAGGLGPTGESRYVRDLFLHPGVRYIILFEGVNDLGTAADGPATAEEIRQVWSRIVREAHAAGIKVFGATVTPFEGNGYYSEDHEKGRAALNEWIRTGGVFDGVIDFDSMVCDPSEPDRLNPAFLFENDWLHPNAAGYECMGSGIDHRLFL
jgi:alpha-glucuronidase